MSATNAIDNAADWFDSRDIIDRIEYLQDEETLTDVERDELTALVDLADEASGYGSDWTHGETLIRDSYFQDYAQELAEEIGAVPSDAEWPTYCIDWERAARELLMDYTSVEFSGVTYWTR